MLRRPRCQRASPRRGLARFTPGERNPHPFRQIHTGWEFAPLTALEPVRFTPGEQLARCPRRTLTPCESGNMRALPPGPMHRPPGGQSGGRECDEPRSTASASAARISGMISCRSCSRRASSAARLASSRAPRRASVTARWRWASAWKPVQSLPLPRGARVCCQRGQGRISSAMCRPIAACRRRCELPCQRSRVTTLAPAACDTPSRVGLQTHAASARQSRE
jgi:hypothetical protein